MSDKNQGTVKFFNREKGFGFIKQNSGSDLFFHISQVKSGEPQENDEVEFTVGEGKRGPAAENVKIVS